MVTRIKKEYVEEFAEILKISRELVKSIRTLLLVPLPVYGWSGGWIGKRKRGEKMGEKMIWYLCDGEKEDCKKRNCYKNTEKNPCRHTKDINHAINFRKETYGDIEVYRETGCD